MTHSIASAKCPNILTSGNYGMSQNRYTDDSKEYIFVKLTDSAYRAIEEYQRNENAKRFVPGQRAQIQFVGNSGVIHFPLPDANNGNNGTGNGGSFESAGRKFGFSIDDVEGSLECIQQQQQNLDVLGPLASRMRIHANDDVYTTTRTKMAIAEETEKSKCIREIKPTQSDIGRKVKKTSSSSAAAAALQQQQHSGHNNSNSGSCSSYLSSSNNRSKLVSSPFNGLASTSFTSSRSPNPTSLGGSGTINNSNGSASGVGNNNNNSGRYGSSSFYSQQQPHHNSNNNNNANSSSNHSSSSSSLPNLTTASSLSSAFAGGISHGYASLSGSSPRESLSSSSMMTGNGCGNLAANRAKMGNSSFGNNARGFANSKSGFGLGSNNIKANAGGNSNSNGGGKMSDVSRRKIRERLIHLLALKPFKKPELHARLRNEGIRDRERSTISNILKDISTMSRDNTYNLRRQIWNDVDENWPFFTEQELQQLKRRKPQNLTPPMSSDAGSSTSGQSPTSTHTGSPPPLVGNGSNSGNNILLGGLGSLSSSGLSNLKRPSLEYDELMFSSVQAKKQRISHYKKESGNAGGSGGGGGAGGGSSSNSNSNNISMAGRLGSSYSNSRGPNLSYSPHSNSVASHNQPNPQPSLMSGDDYGAGSSDLSYNVLDNMDGFMSHVEQQSNSCGSYFSVNTTNTNGKNRKTSSSSGRDSGGGGGSAKQTQKEKRSPGGSNNSSSSNGYENYDRKQSATTAPSMTAGKRTAPSKAAYANSFVPELSKSNSGSNIRSGNGSGAVQQAALATSSRKKNSNSVIYPSQQSSPHDEYNPAYHHSVASSKQRPSSNGIGASTHRQQNSRATAISNSPPSSVFPGSSSSTSSSLSNKQQQQQQNHQNQNQQQPSCMSSSSSSLSYQKMPPASGSVQALAQTNQLGQQSQYPSPTQQLAAAAHSYGSAASMEKNVNSHRYDFSNYTPIMTLEQRRRLKTEFEKDYDEYRELLSLVEKVRRRFQELADCLEKASQHDTDDYDSIKEQILSEYEQLNQKETIHRDKQRFDYLHAKLAHIKQLVTDYDNMLTIKSAEKGAAVPSQAMLIATMPQHADTVPLQQHLQQQNFVYGQNQSLQFPQQSMVRLSPMVKVESNAYEQHHAAETIAQHSKMSASHLYNAQEQQQQQHYPHHHSHYDDNGEQGNSNSSSSNSNNINRYHQQQQNCNGDNANNNNSDSDDSSDSSDSNEDDGEDSNSNLNSDDGEDDEENDRY